VDGAGGGTGTRDIQLGRKGGMEDTPCVFKKALDASMAHFLRLYLSLSALLLRG
jgi:hypothetical protein